MRGFVDHRLSVGPTVANNMQALYIQQEGDARIGGNPHAPQAEHDSYGIYFRLNTSMWKIIDKGKKAAGSETPKLIDNGFKVFQYST